MATDKVPHRAAPLSLATKAVRGFIWVGGSTLLQTVLIFAVYHYLDIRAMGDFEYALIIVMGFQLVGDLGFSSSLVQLRSAGEEHFSASFWLCLIVGLALAAVLVAGSPVFARFVNPESPGGLIQALRILCWMVPFGSVSGVFRARLQRDLRYAAVSASETLSVVAFGIVLFALLPSMGMLGLLVANVFREVGLLAGLWATTRWWPRPSLSLAAIRQMWGFSMSFTGSRLVNYVGVNLPAMFTYQGLGPAATGYFRLAYRLTLTPLTRLATTLHRVLFPALATIQDRNDLLRGGYLRTVESLCLFCWPPLVGMCVFGREILSMARDGQPAFVALVLLGVATLAKVAGTMSGSLFMAKGRADWSLYWSIASVLATLPLLWWVPASWGIAGMAGITAFTSLVFLVATQLMVDRLLEMSPAAFFKALGRPTLVTLTVAVPLFLVRPHLPGAALVELLQRAAGQGPFAALRALIPGPALLVLLQGTLVGLLLYGIALALFGRALLRSYWQTLAGRGAAAAQPAPAAQPGAR